MLTNRLVTPALAKMWLGPAIHYSGSGLKSAIRLAEKIQHGRWNGHDGLPIVLDRDGRVIDGRVRLTAIVRSGIALRLKVKRT
jgi:hypothetical protein